MSEQVDENKKISEDISDLLKILQCFLGCRYSSMITNNFIVEAVEVRRNSKALEGLWTSGSILCLFYQFLSLSWIPRKSMNFCWTSNFCWTDGGGVLQLELLIHTLRTNLAAITDAVGCASDCAAWLSSSEIAKAHTNTSICAILTCWAISSLGKSFIDLEASSGVEALFETCFVCLMVDRWCCSCQWCCE